MGGKRPSSWLSIFHNFVEPFFFNGVPQIHAQVFTFAFLIYIPPSIGSMVRDRSESKWKFHTLMIKIHVKHLVK